MSNLIALTVMIGLIIICLFLLCMLTIKCFHTLVHYHSLLDTERVKVCALQEDNKQKDLKIEELKRPHTTRNEYLTKELFDDIKQNQFEKV